MRAALPYLALAAIAIGFLNFFWSVAESTTIGDAMNGYQQDGHYFVRLRGGYTEVSRETWEWSRIHGLSVLITHPLAMAAMGYMLFRFGFPMFMGGKNESAATMARVEQIRASGPILATARCAGRIRDISIGGPLLGVAVLRAGIVIKPIFMPPRAIAASEITRAVPKRGVLSNRLEIEHAGQDLGSPLVLYVSEQSAVGRAIRGLVSSADEVTRSVGPAAIRSPSPFVSALRIYGLIVVFTITAIVIAVANARALFRRR
jgi:hypothetical protein